MESSAGLVALEACELLSRHMVTRSGVMTVDYFREISSGGQVFIVLVSGVYKWWQDRFPDLLYFFFKSVNDFMYSICQL